MDHDAPEPAGRPATAATDTGGPLAAVRAKPENPHAFGGFGPLLALAVLVVLAIVLAPTVAPERVVLEPVDPPATTTSTTVGATTVPAPGEPAP